MTETLRELPREIRLVPQSELELSPIYTLKDQDDVLAFARRIARVVVKLQSREATRGVRCMYQGFTFSMLYSPQDRVFRTDLFEKIHRDREEVSDADRSNAIFVEQIVSSTYQTYTEGLIEGMRSSSEVDNNSNTWAEIGVKILHKLTGKRQD